MRGKKGFTLIEILVVVVVIAIISLIAFASYRNARLASQNEMARGKLVEVANAARMFNEDNFGVNRVAGGFGVSPVPGFASPLTLFESAGNTDSNFSYIRDTEWDNIAGVWHYRGYRFFICNPTVGGAQPVEECNDQRIAVMLGPTAALATLDGAAEEYGESIWWIDRNNLGLGMVGSTYGGPGGG